MIKEITATGSSLIEAKENARAALGVSELDDVQFEIIDGGTKGILGLFARPAKVRAYIETPDAPEKHKRHEKHNRPKNDSKKPERKGSSEQRVKPQTAAPEKAKQKVIPELELKMERREVGAGEDMSFDFIKTVISDIGLNAEAELYACEDGTRRIAIVGDDASALIGHHGDTLDALQYLANLASAKKNVNGERDKSRVTIDIEGYRAKREDALRALARRMAAKAQRQKRSVMLEPMSAYERRIIHSEIQGIEGVSTNSVGADNNRKIVIYLTDKKPEGIFDEDKELSDTDEYAQNIGAIDQSASADLTDEELADETVSIENTSPAEEIAADDSDIK